MSLPRFTFHRLWAIVLKEFIQMKRDRVTFVMMVGIPLMQLMMFGFAINSDPRHLPTALRLGDQGPFARTLIQALRTSDYFSVVHETSSEAEAQRLLQIALANTIFNRDLPGPLARLRAKNGPVDFRIHAHYNPENITQYNVVPGLMGVVLTMTMVIITALAITRERERGTMENLLATPVRPFEVMVGKILPYIAVGYIQVTLILIAARFIFHVPMVGSLPLLYGVAFLFIAANLAVGITFSTLAKNQLQAVQMAFFFFLPSILLSGFMFPFRGMPPWAQNVGSCLPNTHFLRIVRGILLKGNGLTEIAPELWPLLAFLVVAMTIGVKRYRQTLD